MVLPSLCACHFSEMLFCSQEEPAQELLAPLWKFRCGAALSGPPWCEVELAHAWFSGVWAASWPLSARSTAGSPRLPCLHLRCSCLSGLKAVSLAWTSSSHLYSSRRSYRRLASALIVSAGGARVEPQISGLGQGGLPTSRTVPSQHLAHLALVVGLSATYINTYRQTDRQTDTQTDIH